MCVALFSCSRWALCSSPPLSSCCWCVSACLAACCCSCVPSRLSLNSTVALPDDPRARASMVSSPSLPLFVKLHCARPCSSVFFLFSSTFRSGPLVIVKVTSVLPPEIYQRWLLSRSPHALHAPLLCRSEAQS